MYEALSLAILVFQSSLTADLYQFEKHINLISTKGFTLTFQVVADLSHEEYNKDSYLYGAPDYLIVPISFEMWLCLDDCVSYGVDQNEENDGKNGFFHF